MIRLFCALELPAALRGSLAALAGGVPGARWMAADTMHLTLNFIGNLPESEVADINDALARVRAPGFDLTIEGVGHFARGRRPSQLWAGVARAPALDHLHHKITAALIRAGVEPESRKFTPHVTIARLKGARRDRLQDFLTAHGGLRFAPFAVDHFTLFSSFLGHAGAHYRVEATYPLARD